MAIQDIQQQEKKKKTSALERFAQVLGITKGLAGMGIGLAGLGGDGDDIGSAVKGAMAGDKAGAKSPMASLKSHFRSGRMKVF